MARDFPARKDIAPQVGPRPQPWTSTLTNDAHTEAVLSLGELVIFTLMWTPTDFAAGLVGRCQRCFGGVTTRQAAAWQSPRDAECPDCFGTTFEGGYRAQIVRPAILTDRNSAQIEEKQGTVVTDTVQFETTSDFSQNLGDYMFRFDNTRFQCENMNQIVVRTGFESPSSVNALKGVTAAHMESPTAVAFKIPPADPSFLATQGPITLADLTHLNITIRPNGYL